MMFEFSNDHLAKARKQADALLFISVMSLIPFVINRYS